MKKIFFLMLALLPVLLSAQQTEGIIRYQEVIKLKIELPPEMQQYAAMIPSEDVTNMDLYFNADESLYSLSKIVDEASDNPFEGEGVQVQKVMIGGGGSVSYYYNLAAGTSVRSEDLMGKKFLIESDRAEKEWRVLGEQKVIAGFNCIKAEMTKDSATVTAWFTPEIPVAVGPANFYGLPGAILFLEYKKGETDILITAKEVQLKELDKPIEQPKKGKKVSEEEFEEILDQQIKEMKIMRGEGKGHEASSEGGSIKIEIRQD